MKSNFQVFLVLLALITPSIAFATPPKPGPYASVFLGVTVPKDSTIKAYNASGTLQIDDSVELDPGVFVGGTGGYDFGILRLEGELSYKHSEIKAVTANFAPPIHYRDVDGTLGVLAFMANAFLDLHNDTPVTPYLGGGIGVAALHLSNTHDNNGGLRLYREDDAAAFAYQVGGGLEITLNRLLSLDLAYRYFGTTKAEFEHDKQSGNSTAEMKYESHNMAVGVRFKF